MNNLNAMFCNAFPSYERLQGSIIVQDTREIHATLLLSTATTCVSLPEQSETVGSTSPLTPILKDIVSSRDKRFHSKT